MTSGTMLDLTFPDDTAIQWRFNHCFDINFKIPEGSPEEMFITFDLEGISPVAIGCVYVALNIGNGGEKFFISTFLTKL